MKILRTILLGILGLIVLMCALILLCAANPGLAAPLKDMSENIAAKNAARAARKAEELAKLAEVEAADAASTVEETAEQEPETKEEEEKDDISTDGPETAHPYNFDLTYDDYVKKWDDSTVDKNRKKDSDAKEFVDEFMNPKKDDASSEDYPKDASHMISVQPEIVEIEEEEKAQEIIDSVPSGETGDGLEFDELYYPYYHMLNDRGKALYRQFYANALALNTKFAPAIESVKDNEVESAFTCLLADHPELFWVDISYYFQYDYKGNVIEFDFDFYKNFRDIPASRNKFESKANELVAAAANFSDIEKELYIHNLIVDKLSYQFNSLDQSAYSSVVQNNTVCAGYTRCFQYLMQKLGVPCYFCYGWGGGDRHAWNIIKLDDGYHNVDCTWDDTAESYDFYNLSDSENKNHRRMDFAVYLPKCSSSDYKPSLIVSQPATEEEEEESTDTMYVIGIDANGNVGIMVEKASKVSGDE